MNILDRACGLVAKSTGLILFLTVLLTAFAATRIVDPFSGEMRLEIDPSANRLLSEDNEARIFYDQVRRMFGSDETLVITLTSDDVFTAENLRRIGSDRGDLEAFLLEWQTPARRVGAALDMPVYFDDGYEDALATIHGYLESERIFATGRYGAWEYASMEDAILSGKQVAADVAMV